MATFFLRYTATANKDLDRGTSIHLTPYDKSFGSKKSIAEDMGVETSDLVFVSTHGVYGQVLNGLCGYWIDATSEEEAIELASEMIEDQLSGSSANNLITEKRRPVIFEGVMSESYVDVPDGDLFHPRRIVKVL